MSDRPVRGWTSHGLRAVLVLLAIAGGVRLAWVWLEPVVPLLVGVAVVLAVLSLAIGRRRL